MTANEGQAPDVIFSAAPPAKRLTLPGGVLALLVEETDAATVSVIRQHDNALTFAKSTTMRPVRLLFPVTSREFSADKEIAATFHVSSADVIVSSTLAYRTPGMGFTYEDAAQSAEIVAVDGRLIARAFAVTTMPIPSDVDLFLVIRLPLEEGWLTPVEQAAVHPRDTVTGSPTTLPDPPPPAIDPELIVALRDRVRSMNDQLREIEALIARLEGASAPIFRDEGTAYVHDATVPGAAPTQAFVDAPGRIMNWVIGPPENAGWAYGNNARRLASRLPDYRHVIGGEMPGDVALYFDPIVADRYPVPSAHRILRIGGPRPLDRLFGDDASALTDGLANFDAVVPLNLALHRRVRGVQGMLRFIPNALDLAKWHPVARQRDPSQPFTVGFAASLQSSSEAEVKGYAIARDACERAGVPLLVTQRDKGQIPHERMITDFYARCDVLVHPVAPGREGTSNVVMESLALGLPVICTPTSGFHGETLTDRRNALVCERTVEAFAQAIVSLRDGKRMQQRLALAGRRFAERHHDLEIAARRYRDLLRTLLDPAKLVRQRVCFVPFWEPVEQFASSRLRGQAVVDALNQSGLAIASLGYDPDAGVVVVIQMCSDTVYRSLQTSSQFVVYDVCDRYFEKQKVFKRPDGDVNTLARYRELLARADLVITPTSELKAEVAQREPAVPIVYLPEVADYGRPAVPHPVSDQSTRRVLWFGNPGRGNFDSVRWLLDELRDHHGYSLRIVSQRSFFRSFPDYLDDVVDWSVEGMQAAFRECSLCVVSHADGEQTKSPNRLVAAITHGVPTLVSNSRSCAGIMRAAGADWAVVEQPADVAVALARLENPDLRQRHLRELQSFVADRHDPTAIARAYAKAFEHFACSRTATTTRVGIVTHNLQVGEGAPRSLFELADALGAQPGLEPIAYSACRGELEGLYHRAGVPLTIFDRSVTHSSRSLKTRFGDLRTHFRDFLRRNHIDVLVCNTTKAAPFAYFAREMGIPAIVIVRESFIPEDRFPHLTGEALVATEVGLVEADHIVFVAEESRDAWRDFRFEGTVSVINNGIDHERFADSLAMTKAEARARLGIPPDRFVALCVGSIGTRKGQVDLVSAFTNLPEDVRDRSDIWFVGAAETRHMSPFRAALDQARAVVGDRLHYVGATEDVGAYYRAADMFLINSSNEAYPRSVMEGLLFGLPVLATDAFGMKTQIDHGDNGLVYAVGDMEAWRDAFATLARDCDLRQRLSGNAGRSFWRHVTKAQMVAQYRALIGRLAQRRHAA